jgi:hypothetical protein
MSTRRRYSRALALVTMVASVISLLAPVARAESPNDVCAAFPHHQTYASEGGLLRAPAWHYDKTVTIVYAADTCTSEINNAGNYVLSISGDATVYVGTEPSGEPIDKRPFSSVIRSSARDERLGWPIDWWTCFQGDFSYVWSIEGVYTFAMTASDGDWLMVQKDEVSGDTSGTEFNGCPKRRGAKQD